MLLGIDVGGTYTDAVVVSQGKIIKTAKSPTTHVNLLQGILQSLDKVIDKPSHIERVALSTTVVTNAIVQGKIDPVGLFVMPGPGLNLAGNLPEYTVLGKGYVDHRGREAQPVDLKQVDEAISVWKEQGVRAVAVVGKFSIRNPIQEYQVYKHIQLVWPELDCLVMGHRLSGNLNFVRRIHSAYLNAAVYATYKKFAAAVEMAILQRDISAPVFVLKADGGTMPLSASINFPVETIFTGPAASVLGVCALTHLSGAAVMLDIGGTTTDIALWYDGVPVMHTKGAVVNHMPTHVRSFLLQSVGLGGDSVVTRKNGKWQIGPERLGPAAALGGPEATPTDAMEVLGLSELGQREKSVIAVAKLCRGQESVEDAARQILEHAAEKILVVLRQMIHRLENEPVYRIDQLLARQAFGLETIVGVGGAAANIVPLVAKQLGCRYITPTNSMVANALGAAVARPTLTATLRADTEQGYYFTSEEGVRQNLTSKHFTLEQARRLAVQSLLERAKRMQYDASGEIETIYEEEFNLVRGFYTAGKIMTSCVQLKPGILMRISE